MKVLLLLILAVTANYIPQFPFDLSAHQQTVRDDIRLISQVLPISDAYTSNPQSLNEINLMLHHEAPNLNQLVINKVLMSLHCAGDYHVEHNNVLTVIDYSLPSNEKRFWVFDLKTKKLLFNTYVSHGIKSGALISNYFSNKYNSKASSIGVYQTQKAYYGRDGLSLRLDGLDRNFNDNASNRAVVMHSGWYVEEPFIKKYGRPGRSWGCPALPLTHSKEIINTIKDKTLMVIYYPSDTWFAKSKFLNCGTIASAQSVNKPVSKTLPQSAHDDQREAILFVSSGYKGKRSESYPVAVISADNYQTIFHNTAPLKRMLRRQINNMEFIALSTSELFYLANNPNTLSQNGSNVIHFVIPVIKEVRGGYYETQMEMIHFGTIKDVKATTTAEKGGAPNNFTVYFEGKPAINLNGSSQFIRWVGL